MKKYNYMKYDSTYEAVDDCNANQNWNVISIYPTGWRQEVCVVFYIQEDVDDTYEQGKADGQKDLAEDIITMLSNYRKQHTKGDLSEYIESFCLGIKG